MPTAARRILIIKPSSLGDIVHALPVLAGLHALTPDAHIAWLVNDNFAPFLDGHPLLDEVIRFDRRRYGRMWRSPRAFAAFWRFVAELRSKRFDLVLDLQGLIRSGLIAYFSGAARRVGFADARECASLFYNLRVKCPETAVHAVEKNTALARELGLDVAEPSFPLGITPDETHEARRLLAQAAGGDLRGFSAVLPGARWESKRWPAEKIGALIGRMQDAGLPPCVLLGAPDERHFAEEVQKTCRSAVIDLVGRTSLRELTACLDLAEIVVCHDSGPMHIAAALNKPTVAIFGPTNPERTGPFSKAARVVRRPLECMPCYRRVCPLGHHRCMQDLEVDEVLEQVRTLHAGLIEGRNTCAG